MNRRRLLAASALALLAPAARVLAAGAQHTEYTPETYRQALASGQPFLLDFYAPW